MELRDYQAADLVDLYAAWETHRRVLYCLPTGAGKTVVATHVIDDAVQSGERVLVLTHRRELIDQMVARLAAADLDDVGVIRASDDRYRAEACVQVASVQTLAARPDERPHADLVVVDEAHHATADTWLRILECYPTARVLGLTATPFRASGKGLDDCFDVLVQGKAMSALIAERYLVAPRSYTVPEDLLPELSGVRSIGGDYHQGELSEAVCKRSIVGGMVAERQRLAPGRSTVVYAVDRRHAKIIVEQFSSAEVPTGYLDGNTPDAERQDLLYRLRIGKIEVLVNVGVLTEGWDFPDLECVILGRPTKSLGLYMQMIGRLLRTGRHNRRPIFCDHAGCIYMHDLPEVDRVFELCGLPPGQAKAAGVKRCPECGEVASSLARTCECGHVYWSVEDGPPGEVLALLEEAKPRQTTCPGWGEVPCEAMPPKGAFTKTSIRRRHGDLWRCKKCAGRKMHADPAWWKAHDEAMRKRRVADPAWQKTKAERARKRAADPPWQKAHASYYEANKERFKEYYEANKERIKAARRTREAKKKAKAAAGCKKGDELTHVD